MESTLARLVCILLVFSSKVTHVENQTVNLSTSANPDFNLTELTTASISFNSTESPTESSTEDAINYTSVKQENENITPTAAAAENMSQHQTFQSATTSTLPTDSTSLNTTVTTHNLTSTTHFISMSDSPESSTAKSSQSITTSSNSANTIEGLRLKISERNMTIIFSSMLGVFALTLVMIMFYKWRHKVQYLHQPLYTTDETDEFVPDGDTLVISGGLYDGHPIYDNIPPTPAEQSQFHLQFLQ